MAVQVSYPGVYIEEFAPGAPIEGVGTATAAFLGPTKDGTPNEPTKITNWDTFLTRFGADPIDGFYLWYAVRGFFENNGKVCYITRVSNGKFDFVVLKDRSSGGGRDTIRLQARMPGDNTATPIKVAVADSHAVIATGPTAAKIFRPTATVDNASGSVIQVTVPDEAAQFLGGNSILIKNGGKTDTAVVARVEGDLIRLTGNLTKSFVAGDNAKVQLVNLSANVDDAFRVVNGKKLTRGSVIKLSQVPGGAGTPPAVEDVRVVKSVEPERISPTLTTYRVTLKETLKKQFDLSPTANDIGVESQEFKLTITKDGYSNDYDELSMDSGHPSFFSSVINNDVNGIITAAPVEPPNTTPGPDNRPATTTAARALAGGGDENLQTLGANDYKKGLRLLEAIDDVNMISIPDRQDADVQLAIIAHCESMQDRFGILDSLRSAPLFGGGSVEGQRRGVESKYGYAAIYYPWLKVASATDGKPMLVPPSGHVAGIYARIDNSRGVHKAPAGTEALVNGALGIETGMSDVDQGQLNLQGINVIRVFQAGGRPTVWGSRTTASDKNWQYVNIRRLFLFLEESIQEGIMWAVFEPNNLSLWQKLNRSIRAFLLQQWRDGALFGATPEEAFYVRIDEVLNPDSQRALGRLYIEIGVRPSYPAEFIIVRIGIWQGGGEVTEV